MARLMFDSDDLSVLLTAHCDDALVATYADLVTPQFIDQMGWRLVVIDRGAGDPHGVATVADIEPGLLTVAQGEEKIRQWIEEGRPYPTAYHDRAQWAEVNAALAGVSFAHWVATLDGTLVPSGYYMAAVQFAKESMLGFHADMSVVWADGWHPSPPPPSASALAEAENLAGQLANGLVHLAALVKGL
jgi:hypothetical protein